jgi:hypothetical protein
MGHLTAANSIGAGLFKTALRCHALTRGNSGKGEA